MTPHEHYKTAENLLGILEKGGVQDMQTADSLLRAAQVHATLASVATWPPDERGNPYKKS